jgi:hypothetical protein
MRAHTFAGPLAAAAALAVWPAAGLAQTATYNFASSSHGFTSVDGGTGLPATAWDYGTTVPAPGGGAAWSLPGQTTSSQFAVQSPAALYTVTTLGPVSGSFSHRFNFAVVPSGGEGTIAYAGGVIQYRLAGGSWVTLTETQVGGEAPYTSAIPNDIGNPLGDLQAFTGQSFGYEDPMYVTTSFVLGGAANASFNPGDQIEIRFLAGFANDTPPFADPSWQIGSLTLNDGLPVPEPAGVLGAAALAALGFHRLRRRRAAATSAATASGTTS